MNTIYHGLNLNLHNVLDVNMRRQDNGVIKMTVRHKVHDCTDDTHGVAEFELCLFPAEGGILVAPVHEPTTKAAA